MDALKDFLPFDKWLKKEDLIINKIYFCRARNFKYGKWNGTTFDYTRNKWVLEFEDVEYHCDDGPPYGTVKPLKIKGKELVK